MGYKNFVYIFLFILGCTLNVSGQEKRLAKADESFDSYAYIDARAIYLDVAKSGYSSANLFKKLADSYYFNGQLEDAVIWYEKLIDAYPEDLEPEYLFRYSQSLKSEERYKDSDKVMEQFNAITGNDQRAAYFMNARDYLNFIELQSGKFRINKLTVNSKFSDYAPSFYKDKLVFASSRGGGGLSKTIHEWNEMPFLDLYTSEIVKANGILKTPQKIRGKMNTKFHESSSSFSKDGNTVYFTRNNYTKKKIGKDVNGTILLKLYKATYERDKWRTIEEVPFNSEEYSVSHPTLTADGTKLYFASDMPGTRGLSDLYVVDVLPDGTYGTPQNLGDKINTEGRETFPYITDSGRLFFASDGHIGLGGLDVFIAVPEENGFSVPYNVGKPINSPDDDFTFVLNEDTKLGYFASNRKGGKGSDDIYSFKQTDDLITTCRQYVAGEITDANTREILPGADVILMDTNNTEIERTQADEQGKYLFMIDCDTPYLVRAVNDEYKPTEAAFKSTNVFEFTNNMPLQLGKGGLGGQNIQPGDDLAKILQLDPIYFDLDKSYIRADAEVELQKVIAAMKQYPNLKIDVRSHTDSRAVDYYNMRLSERRAQSTMKYIREKGKINRKRLTGRGYGEISLVNECSNGVPCSKEKHQLNRRSEFIVLK